MSHAIAQLEIHLQTLRTNEPINRREGNIEQADLEAEAIRDTEKAIKALLSKPRFLWRLRTSEHDEDCWMLLIQETSSQHDAFTEITDSLSTGTDIISLELIGQIVDAEELP